MNFGFGPDGGSGDNNPGKSNGNSGYTPPNEMNNSGSIEESKQPTENANNPAGGGDDYPGEDNENRQRSYTLRAFNSTPMFIESLTDLSV